MRIWHQSIINKLPRQQLLGQHRECCALRGLGWYKKHSVINYIFLYEHIYLFCYHVLIMKEMDHRGYNVTPEWKRSLYRGKKLNLSKVNENHIDCTIRFDKTVENSIIIETSNKQDEQTIYNLLKKNPIYAEHNDGYLKECLNNLKNKNVIITI